MEEVGEKMFGSTTGTERTRAKASADPDHDMNASDGLCCIVGTLMPDVRSLENWNRSWAVLTLAMW